MNRTRRFLAGLLAAAVVLSPAAASGKSGSSWDDNRVELENHNDNSYVARSKLKVVRVSGDVVDAKNIASAYANCTDCTTIAAAVQVVLAGDNPSQVVPENYAVAVNEECTRCKTMATAHQFVITTDGRMNFTDNGEEAIEDIEEDLEYLVESDPEPAHFGAEMDRLMNELQQILDTQLQKSGRDGDIEEDDDDDSDED